MPNCFMLRRRTDGEPESLVTVDERMCAEFGVPCTENWYQHWYDIIGFGLAIGRDLEEMREELVGHKLEKVCTFIHEHYTVEAWAER